MSHSLLIVDDDVALSMVMQTSLEQEGYKVYTAHHAKDALRWLEHHSTDIEVMLLDWSMPDISGIDLLKQIKQQKEYENIQVIMQTVFGAAENIKQGIDAGAFFYLVKPVSKTLLTSTIRAAIQDYGRKKELLKKLKESEHSFKYLNGHFTFRTIEEGDYLAVRIANICPRPEEAMYITELFANAVEHGNLGIGYEEKSKLVTDGRLSEEYKRRASLDENKNKAVSVSFHRNNSKITVLIEDQGSGFDFEKFIRFDDDRVLHNHGRGIAISNAFLKMKYLENGNKVMVEFPLESAEKLNGVQAR